MTRLLIIIIILLGLFGSLLANESEVDQEAKEIVKGAGVNGGFCVVLGVTDGQLIASLGSNGKFLIHGLAFTADLKKAREFVRSEKLYGRVSIDVGSIKHLSYTDNIVSLLVIKNAEKLFDQGLGLGEILRVLSPRGVVCFDSGVTKEKVLKAGFENIKVVGSLVFGRKPRSSKMDEWTHWRYNSTRTATSKDRLVGLNESIRWIDHPRRARGHKSPPASCVSSGGRLFYIYDYGPLFQSVPNQAALVARDAYNGIFLWKKPVVASVKHSKLVFQGRAVVAYGDYLYAPLKNNGPLIKMDAATGKELLIYKDSKPESVIHLGAFLLLLSKSKVRLLNEKSGAEVWSYTAGGRNNRMLANGKYLFIKLTRHKALICLNLSDGKKNWTLKDEKIGEYSFLSAPVPEMLIHSSKNLVRGISTKDGEVKWSHSYKTSSRGSAKNFFYSSGLVWVHNTLKPLGGGKGESWHGIDPLTGQLKKEFPVSFVDKCAIGKATEKYLITGRLDFTDLKSGKTVSSKSVRASCNFGAVPANGMIYTFPTDCRCFPQIKGIMGLGTMSKENSFKTTSPQLEKGSGKAIGDTASKEDWPIYRGGAKRLGSTQSNISANLKEVWTCSFEGAISPPVIAAEKVFLSEIDLHQVHAVNAITGKLLWSFSAGGLVSQAPTYYKGLVLFGCDNGKVYCLNALSGKLVWKFRAALSHRRLIAYGQVASAWPVLGSVLVDNDRVYFSAGRHTGLDKGIMIYCLDPVSGKVYWKNKLKSFYFQDLMIKSEKSIFMGARIKIDPRDGKFLKYLRKAKVLAPSESSPFADDTFANRTKWIYQGISGQMLSIDNNNVVGFICFNSGHKRASVKPGNGEYKFFIRYLNNKNKVVVPLTIRPRAMLLAKDKIFLTGSEDKYPAAKNILLCLSIKNAKELSTLEVPAPPVFDGLAAARGRLFIAGLDNKLRCYGAK